MRQARFPLFQVGIVFLIIVLLSSCPPMDRLVLCPVKQPTMLAFRHQIDLDSFRLTLDTNTRLATAIDDGFEFRNRSLPNFRHDFWLNDSVLIVKINAVYRSIEYDNTISGRVTKAHRLRDSQAYLIEAAKQEITSIELRESYYYEDPTNPILQFGHQLYPVDSLLWRANTFGSQSNMSFRNGILHDSFSISDTLRQLQITGHFNNGQETGTWHYYDLFGQLQWTERYLDGELQEIEYQDDAHLKREDRLPTLRELIFLHRIFLFVFAILLAIVLKYFVHSYQGFGFPYRDSERSVIVRNIVASPFIGLTTMVVFGVFFLVCLSMLKTVFGWDVPYHILGLPFAVLIFIFPFTTFSYLITFRVDDIFWYSIIFTLSLLLAEEWKFLESLNFGF